ncbi:MAG: hypothetical protein ACTSQG_10225, partial [Promethearchaeota archaeon]
ERTGKLQTLGINQITSENIINSTELEKVLIKNSLKTFIIISTPGSIAEFSQFFENNETEEKIFLLIPHEHFGNRSYISEQVMKFVFKPPRGIAWPYRNSLDIIKVVQQYLTFSKDEIIINEEEILMDFRKWKEDLMTKKPDMSLDEDFFKRKPEDMVVYDWLFICIIPTTISKDLVDFCKPNYISEIEKFYDSYPILSRNSQVNCVNRFLKESDDVGNIIKLHKDGRIFICLRYAPQLKVKDKSDLKSVVEKSKHNRMIFNIEPLFVKRQSINCEKAQEKYGTPIKDVMPGNLEHIFKIVCFPFHKNCKVQMVRTTTKKFKACFSFPNMKKNNFGRILYQRNHIGPIREYLADDEESHLHLEFKYENISSMLNIFKNQCLNDFKTPKNISYV